MKKGAFSALVYRELLICRKSLAVYPIPTVIFSLFPILIALSLRYGNLAMLPQSIVADLRANDDLMLKLCTVASPCMLSLAVSEASVHDTKRAWDRFRGSAPVSPARMALAKYVLFAAMLAVSFGVSVLFLNIFAGCMDIPVTRRDIGMILLMIALTGILSVMAQVFIMLLRSVDRGMLAMLGCIAAVIFLIPREWVAAMDLQGVLRGTEALLPLLPAILAGTLILGWGLTALLYRRREK